MSPPSSRLVPTRVSSSARRARSGATDGAALLRLPLIDLQVRAGPPHTLEPAVRQVKAILHVVHVPRRVEVGRTDEVREGVACRNEARDARRNVAVRNARALHDDPVRFALEAMVPLDEVIRP